MEPLAPGDPITIGPYTLLGELGQGGMGKVYIGGTNTKVVAVKVIKSAYAEHPEFRKRFEREVNLARKVSSPYTADIVDADPRAAHPWMATEFIEGLSLSEAINDFGPFTEPRFKVLAAGLAEALAFIHHCNILHRDFKPSNVVITHDGGPRVIDFGIAKALDATDFTSVTPLTPTNGAPGSPGYMSPEQIEGRELTAKSDVFTLGSVLYYACTGRPPFGHGLEHAISYRILHQEPDIDTIPCFRSLIADCLEKQPDDRPSLTDVQRRIGPVGVTDNETLLPGSAKARIDQFRDTLRRLDRTRTRSPRSQQSQTGTPRQACHAARGEPTTDQASQQPTKKEEAPGEGQEEPDRPRTDAPTPVLLRCAQVVLALAGIYTVIGWIGLALTTWAGTRYEAAAELDIPTLISWSAISYSLQLGALILHLGLLLGFTGFAIWHIREYGFEWFLAGTLLVFLIPAGLALIILDAIEFPAAVWILDNFT